MSIVTAFLLCMGVFAMLRFVGVPRLRMRLERALAAKDRRGILLYAGPLAAAEKALELSLIASMAFFVLALAVVGLTFFHFNSLDRVGSILEMTVRLRERLKVISDHLSAGTFVFVFALMAVLWYRAGKRGALHTINGIAVEERRRLEEMRAQDPAAWQQLAPDDAMKSVWFMLQAKLQEMEALPQDKATEAAKREELRREADKLYVLYNELDLTRRLSPRLDAVAPANGWMRVFMSQGTFQDLRGAAKLLSYGLNAAFALLLVGFGSGTAATALQARTVALSDLQVKLSLQESAKAREHFEQRAARLQKPAKPQVPLTPQDQAAAHALAQSMSLAFAENVASSLQADHASAASGPGRAGHRPSADEAARDFIRADLQSRTAARDTEEARAAYRSEASSGAEAKPVYDYAKSSAAQDSPRISERFYAAIQKEQHADIGGFRSAVRTWYDSHREPVSFSSLTEWTFGETIGRLLGLTPLVPEDGALKFPGDVVADAVKDAALHALDIEGDRFFASFYETGSVGAGLAQMRSPSRRFRVVSSDLAAVLQTNIPDDRIVEQAAAERASSVNWAFETGFSKEAEAAVKDLPAPLIKDRESAVADLFANFDSEFLPRGKHVDSGRDRVLAVLGGTDPNPPEVRQRRATDLSQLETYSRVGGIVFGAAVPNQPVLDFVDFSWEPSGDETVLRMARRDGQRFTLGRFRSALVYQALGYAADGRLVVATLLNASLIEREQVMLHPAFAGTPLGCRLLRDDQWIFHYTDPEGSANQPSRLRTQLNAVGQDMELYRLALKAIKNPDQVDPSVEMPRAVPAASSPFDSPAMAGAFRPELVAAVRQCRSQTTGPQFVKCIQRAGVGTSWATLLPENAPDTAFVSQMREAPYSLDRDLRFLIGDSAIKSTWPMEWTVQVTVDNNASWAFPAFDAKMIESVLDGLQREHRLGELVELKQLCILQRFARVAFAGKFGKDFPLQKLLALAEATRPSFSNRFDTPRWLRVNTARAERSGYAELFRAYRPPSQNAQFREAPALFTACAAVLDGEPEGDRVKRNCVWPELQEKATSECRVAVDSGQSFQDADACQVYLRAAEGQALAAVFELREKLGATHAPSDHDLRCPACPVRAD